MNKKPVIYGFLMGIAAPLLVVFVFVFIYINHNFGNGLMDLKARGQLGNIMRLGLLANLVLFTFLIRRKELLARGILIATLLILIVSLLF
jgi:uncharacterized membrane protein YphA (DoxX/SURF4 family)